MKPKCGENRLQPDNFLTSLTFNKGSYSTSLAYMIYFIQYNIIYLHAHLMCETLIHVFTCNIMSSFEHSIDLKNVYNTIEFQYHFFPAFTKNGAYILKLSGRPSVFLSVFSTFIRFHAISREAFELLQRNFRLKNK